MAKLQKGEIDEALKTLDGWTLDGDAIAKEYTFATFPDAVAFLVRVAFAAEASDHHPDVAIHYRRLSLRYWTHTEGGVTRRDVDGAREAERLFTGA